MSYRFERDECVTEGVVRIARGQADKALKGLAGTRNPRERLHESRTSIKKLRALLRLVRPLLGRRFAREDARLRKMGRDLSELRDATVLVETCDTLGRLVEKALRPSLARARRHLEGGRIVVEARLDGPGRVERTAAAFRKTTRRIEQWISARSRAGSNLGAVLPGLRQIYRRGRRTFHAAYDTGSADAFHAWRRAVKYHGYHLRLLGEVLPVAMEARLAKVEQLGQVLGVDHDLTLLGARLRLDSDSLGDNVKVRLLERRIAQQQVSLRVTARQLGETLYADPPSVFFRHLELTRKAEMAKGKAKAKAKARGAAT